MLEKIDKPKEYEKLLPLESRFVWNRFLSLNDTSMIFTFLCRMLPPLAGSVDIDLNYIDKLLTVYLTEVYLIQFQNVDLWTNQHMGVECCRNIELHCRNNELCTDQWRILQRYKGGGQHEKNSVEQIARGSLKCLQRT
jgi:hypothetical protein